eukprot:1186194-Lingulodinium_polyedra.AAC.1
MGCSPACSSRGLWHTGARNPPPEKKKPRPPRRRRRLLFQCRPSKRHPISLRPQCRRQTPCLRAGRVNATPIPRARSADEHLACAPAE